MIDEILVEDGRVVVFEQRHQEYGAKAVIVTMRTALRRKVLSGISEVFVRDQITALLRSNWLMVKTLGLSRSFQTGTPHSCQASSINYEETKFNLVIKIKSLFFVGKRIVKGSNLILAHLYQ